MGPSGAGKTTLLNFISQKANTQGLIFKSGFCRFILDGYEEKKSFRNLSGYVTQDDILIEIMTPVELLHFAADIKLPNKHGSKKNRVNF